VPSHVFTSAKREVKTREAPNKNPEAAVLIGCSQDSRFRISGLEPEVLEVLGHLLVVVEALGLELDHLEPV